MERKGFIGGSDCVQILQGNWLDLWQIKTGRKEPEDLSNVLAVQLGITTEDFNLAWFEKQHNCMLSNYQHRVKKEVGNVPVIGTVDAMWNGNIIEAKHTNSFNNMSKALEYYMPQLQLYMHINEADGAYLSVIFGNSYWESVHVKRNQDYFNSMWSVVSDFWGYVVRDEEPIAVDTPPISIDQIPLDQMVARDASHDNMFIDAAVTYVNGLEVNKAFENAKKDLKNMVADNEREVYCDYLTIKRDKRGALRITKRNQK